MVISVGASSVARRTHAITAPTAIPMPTPATALSTNSPPAFTSEKDPVTTAATATL